MCGTSRTPIQPAAYRMPKRPDSPCFFFVAGRILAALAGVSGLKKLQMNGLSRATFRASMNAHTPEWPHISPANLASLTALKQLTHLDLRYTGLCGNPGLEASRHRASLEVLAAALAALTQLTHLELAGCAIGPDPQAATLLGPSLSCLADLTYLGLGRNSLTSQIMALLGPSLASLSGLKVLDLNGNFEEGGGLTAEAASAIAGTAASLEALELYGCLIGRDGGEVLAPALALLKKLRTLGLGYNELSPTGAAFLAPSLMTLTALEKLDLSHNGLGDNHGLRPRGSSGGGGTGDDPISQIFSALGSLTRLRTLQLDNNRFKCPTLTAFAMRHLSGLVNLEIFDLSGISGSGMQSEGDREVIQVCLCWGVEGIVG